MYFFNDKMSFGHLHPLLPTITHTFIVLMCKLKPQTKPATKIPVLCYSSAMETWEFKKTINQRTSINRNWKSSVSQNSLKRH